MKRLHVHPLWRVVAALALTTLACVVNGGGEKTPPPPATAVPATPEPNQPQPATPEPNQPQPTGTADLSQSQRAKLIAATVQIWGLQNNGGKLQPIYTGSGTILSEDGLILTNAHVASPAAQGDFEYEPDALGIALVEREDQPPVLSYYAEVMAVDGYLDLAVIKIAQTMDGSRVDGSRLSLPFVPLGDSDAIHVGDALNIFGFPGIGGETITFTKGSVSGFTSEEGLGDRAWIKTDATIAGGNSGGLGSDNIGRIIGVPTRASATEGDVTDCRVIQDTNGDGVLDQNDTCIPIGGFINALRPVALAMPLIKAAQSGVEYVSPFGTAPEPGVGGTGQEQISGITWAHGADDNGNAVGVADSFESGISEIYAFFDYSGFTDGENFGYQWFIDGEKVVENQFAWDGGESGNYFAYLYSNSGALSDGAYEIDLYAGDELTYAGGGTTTIGGGTVTPPDTTGLVTINGRITDADTGRGIPGALFLVLRPGTDPQAWLDNGSDSDVLFVGQADNDGYYEVTGLERDVHYSVVVGLKGYQPKFSDDFFITASDPDVVTVDIELQK